MPRHVAAQAQEELLRAIFDSAPIGVSIRDLQGRYVRSNPAFQAMTGYTESELRGKTDQSLTYPEDVPRTRILVEELFAGRRKSFTLVKRYRTKSGETLWARNKVSLLKDGGDAAQYLIALTENVTEKRLAQEQRRESDERFRLLVASVTDYAIYQLDPQGRVASWNAGAERINGYRADEIIGRHFSVFYPSEDIKRSEPARELDIAAAQDRFEDEGWRLRKDGSSFWASVVITPMRDATGALRGYAKVTRDLSARRQLEQSLRLSEANLKTFFDHSPALAFMKDLAGRYTLVNTQFEQRFGLSQAEILGSTDHQLFAPDQAAAFRANDREVLTRGAPLEFEEQAQYVDGPRISIVCKFPLHDATGAVVGIGGLVTDITERKRAEEEMRASEQSFRELIHSLPIAVYVCDAAGLIEMFNRRAAELWGREPRIGDRADRFCGSYRIYTPAGAHLPHADCPMGEVLRTGRAVAGREIVIERPDGSHRSAVVNIIPRRDAQGNLSGAINCLTDITSRIRAEQEVKEYAEQLRALSQRRMEIEEEYGLALSRELHDRVGQNLTALNVNLDIVLGELPPGAGATIAPRLQDSQELVRATVDSITDLMAELRPPLLDDYGLLPALRAIGEQFARRTGVEVAVRGSDGFGRLHRQREVALCRIAQEALTNLAKHAQATRVDIELARHGDQLRLTIADNGIGFDPNEQAPGRIRAGWGMLTMRERAQAIGGMMTLDSAPGQGTRVIVALQG